MNNCQKVKALDNAFHGIIAAINRADYEKVKAEYQSWLSAREGLKSSVAEAGQKGDIALGAALEKYAEASHFCLDGDIKQMYKGYADYVESRKKVVPLACSGFLQRITEATETKIELSVPFLRNEVDLQKVLHET
jgi:hypothetical protein